MQCEQQNLLSALPSSVAAPHTASMPASFNGLDWSRKIVEAIQQNSARAASEQMQLLQEQRRPY
uniref:HK1b2 n=1 Tax=Arundo donax TaxID=35708 RepID=A0A0A9FTQ4_ARUDO